MGTDSFCIEREIHSMKKVDTLLGDGLEEHNPTCKRSRFIEELNLSHPLINNF